MLFNWCLALGFDKSKVLPSVAFCSDESQGYPTMIIAKHFGWSVTQPSHAHALITNTAPTTRVAYR